MYICVCAHWVRRVGVLFLDLFMGLLVYSVGVSCEVTYNLMSFIANSTSVYFYCYKSFSIWSIGRMSMRLLEIIIGRLVRNTEAVL
jgi:hypothetical protein